MYLVTDNRDLQSEIVHTSPGLSHWPKVAAWWKERIRYVGPCGELTTVVFVHISADTGLDRVHPTWAGTYILDACVFLFPATNFGLIDSDCVPVTLFEVQELWSSTDSSQPVKLTEAGQTERSSPIVPSHKRARSVDTRRDTQQPGPLSKLSRSLSADNLAATAHAPASAPTCLAGDNLADEVDYGSSPEPSPRRAGVRTPSSTDNSPTMSNRSPAEARRLAECKSELREAKGVILVSEAFTEINAGLVIVLASGHEPPISASALADPELDPDEAVDAVVKAYHMHVEAYLATTFPPQMSSSGLPVGYLAPPCLEQLRR